MADSGALRHSGRARNPSAKVLENVATTASLASERSQTARRIPARTSVPAAGAQPAQNAKKRAGGAEPAPAADGDATLGTAPAAKKARAADSEPASGASAKRSEVTEAADRAKSHFSGGQGQPGRASQPTAGSSNGAAFSRSSDVRPSQSAAPVPGKKSLPPQFVEVLSRIERLEQNLARSQAETADLRERLRTAIEQKEASVAREQNLVAVVEGLKTQIANLSKAVTGMSVNTQKEVAQVRAEVADLATEVASLCEEGQDADVSEAEDEGAARMKQKPVPKGKKGRSEKKASAPIVPKDVRNQLQSCARCALASARGISEQNMGTDALPAWTEGADFDYAFPPSHERNRPGFAKATTWAKSNRKRWSALAQSDENFAGFDGALKTAFESLRKRFKAASRPEEEKGELAIHKRRSERKRRKASSRQAVLKELWAKERTREFKNDLLDTNVFPLEEIVDMLSAQMMSTDESCDDSDDKEKDEEQEDVSEEEGGRDKTESKKKLRRRTHAYRSPVFTRLLDTLDDPIVRDELGEAVHSDDGGRAPRRRKLPALVSPAVSKPPSCASWETISAELAVEMLERGVPLSQHWRAQNPKDPKRQLGEFDRYETGLLAFLKAEIAAEGGGVVGGTEDDEEEDESQWGAMGEGRWGGGTPASDGASQAQVDPYAGEGGFLRQEPDLGDEADWLDDSLRGAVAGGPLTWDDFEYGS